MGEKHWNVISMTKKKNQRRRKRNKRKKMKNQRKKKKWRRRNARMDHQRHQKRRSHTRKYAMSNWRQKQQQRPHRRLPRNLKKPEQTLRSRKGAEGEAKMLPVMKNLSGREDLTVHLYP